ncbi:hypothetical protein, partial [Glaesserella parasuis]|uniref:hypothetical protein n=1 Tax=Glaesserella parasuis TaxID=738 RepID=UPI003851FACA
MPFHFLFHIIPFNSIFSLIYLTYLMMVMLDWFNNKIPVSECIISETGIYTNCGRGSLSAFFVHRFYPSAPIPFANAQGLPP